MLLNKQFVTAATHCNTLQHPATHRNTLIAVELLSHSVLAVCCNVLQCFAVYCRCSYVGNMQCVAVSCKVCCSVLQRVAACCSVLMRLVRRVCRAGQTCESQLIYHTQTHVCTLQHTATHCNTLQHIATHCNTL